MEPQGCERHRWASRMTKRAGANESMLSEFRCDPVPNKQSSRKIVTPRFHVCASHRNCGQDNLRNRFLLNSITGRGRDPVLSRLILHSKIPPVLAVKAALGAECRWRFISSRSLSLEASP